MSCQKKVKINENEDCTNQGWVEGVLRRGLNIIMSERKEKKQPVVIYHRKKPLTAHIFTLTQHQRVSAPLQGRVGSSRQSGSVSTAEHLFFFKSSTKDMKPTKTTEFYQRDLEYFINVGKWRGADSKRSIVFARLRILNLVS